MSTSKRTIKMTSTSIRAGSSLPVTVNTDQPLKTKIASPTKEVCTSPVEMKKESRRSKTPSSKIPSFPIPKFDVKSKVGSKENIKHKPGGG
jgi:hypothetical protein